MSPTKEITERQRQAAFKAWETIRRKKAEADGAKPRKMPLKHRGRCEELNGTWAQHRRSKGKVKIRFTIAHLCHTPKCDDESHLRAMCEPCHLIYDLRCRQRGLHGDRAFEWAIQQS
jgi:hypothetical protein